jgi:hypothetical protein
MNDEGSSERTVKQNEVRAKRREQTMKEGKKQQKIPAQEDVKLLLDNYPWISQRTWAHFFDVSTSSFNGWANKNSGVPEDALRVIRLLNAVEEKKRETVAKLLSTSGIGDFARFIASIEHLAMKSDWIKFFSGSVTRLMGENLTPGSVLFDFFKNFDKDREKDKK